MLGYFLRIPGPTKCILKEKKKKKRIPRSGLAIFLHILSVDHMLIGRCCACDDV
jgi:hypothetical protein